MIRSLEVLQATCACRSPSSCSSLLPLPSSRHCPVLSRTSAGIAYLHLAKGLHMHCQQRIMHSCHVAVCCSASMVKKLHKSRAQTSRNLSSLQCNMCPASRGTWYMAPFFALLRMLNPYDCLCYSPTMCALSFTEIHPSVKRWQQSYASFCCFDTLARNPRTQG
jgi:hypothetical protein